MASLVSQTTATTSFGDLSLSALENLRYIVSALTTNHEVGQPLNLAEARRFLLDTYFQNLLDPLACSVGNQTPSGTMKSLLEGNFVPLRFGSRIQVTQQRQLLDRHARLFEGNMLKAKNDIIERQKAVQWLSIFMHSSFVGCLFYRPPEVGFSYCCYALVDIQNA